MKLGKREVEEACYYDHNANLVDEDDYRVLRIVDGWIASLLRFY